ncbi:transposase [Arthrobacter globiformis]|nr:transposase [Arthrobacter globiformis]
MLGDRQFPADHAGYQQLLDWAASFGIINTFGVECTGSYGAGLTRHLLAAGIDVVEVNKGHSQVRQRVGKSDAVDAEAAARKVLSGECSDPAKDTTGAVEAIRNLHLVRGSAIKARSAACVQLRDVLLTAPDHLRTRLTAKTLEGKATQARTLRPDLSRIHEPEQAVKYALRELGRRIYELTAEINETDKYLTQLVSAVAPNTLALPQVGPVSVAQLLITAGENLNASAAKPPSRGSAASRPSLSPPGNHIACDSIGEVTAKPTGSSTSSPSAASAMTRDPRPIVTGSAPKATHQRMPSAASNALSPERSTTALNAIYQ